MIYSHYFGFFIILIQAILIIVLKGNRKQNLIRYGILLSCMFLLYIPHLQTIFMRFTTSTTHGTWLDPPAGIDSLYYMLWTFSNQPVVTVVCIMLLVVTPALAIMRKRSTRHKTDEVSARNKISADEDPPGQSRISGINNLAVIIWFVFPFFFMFIISFWIPMFFDRYLIFVSIGYYFLLAVCADNLIRRPGYRIIIPVLLVLSISTFFIYFQQ